MKLAIILDKKSHIVPVVEVIKLNGFKVSPTFSISYRGKGETYISLSEDYEVKWGLVEWLVHSGINRKEISSTDFLKGME